MFGRPRAHDGLARTRSRVTVAGCQCAASVALMSRIRGLRAAAAMHAAGSLLREWSIEETRAHLDAEDEGDDSLFSLMLAASRRPGVPAATRARTENDLIVLRGDHRAWRDGYLDQGLAVPKAELARHSATEDRLAVDLKRWILDEAADRGLLLPEMPEHVVSATVGRESAASTGYGFLGGVKDAVFAVPTWDLDLRGRSKFEDPWISQGRGSHTPTGREYLAALPASGPLAASSRVDAMLAKILGPAGDSAIPGEAELRAIGETLRQRIDADAIKTREATWRGWDYLNEKTGNSFLGTAFVEGMKWISTWFDPGSYGASAKAHAMAVGSMATAIEQMVASMTAGLPYPWHAFELAPVDVVRLRDHITKTKDSATDFWDGMASVAEESTGTQEALDQLDAVARTLTYNNQRWTGNPPGRGAMPEPTRRVAIAWYGMLANALAEEEAAANAAGPAGSIIYMTSPRPVTRAFRAMHGGEWGAFDLASDEQAMIVAAAVGSAYEMSGPQTRDLAIALWERSAGWSAEPILMTQTGGLGGLKVADGTPTTPTDATQIQWWQLARNASAIASAWKRGTVAPERFAPYDPREPATARPSGAGGATGMSAGAKVALGLGVIAAGYGVYSL